MSHCERHSCSITQGATLAGDGIKFLIVVGADAQEAAVDVLTHGLPAQRQAHLALVHVCERQERKGVRSVKDRVRTHRNVLSLVKGWSCKSASNEVTIFRDLYLLNHLSYTIMYMAKTINGS